MKHDIDGSGEREIRCSVYTLTVYEQEFKSSMVKDVYGVIDLRANGAEVVTAEYVANRLAAAMPEGGDGKRKPLPKATLALVARAFPDTIVTTIDYTADNWEAYVRAYWAMLRTGDALSGGAQTTPPSMRGSRPSATWTSRRYQTPSYPAWRTACFTPALPAGSGDGGTEYESLQWTALFTSGLKLNVPYSELLSMRVPVLLMMLESQRPRTEPKRPTVRKATQADIDALLFG